MQRDCRETPDSCPSLCMLFPGSSAMDMKYAVMNIFSQKMENQRWPPTSNLPFQTLSIGPFALKAYFFGEDRVSLVVVITHLILCSGEASLLCSLLLATPGGNLMKWRFGSARDLAATALSLCRCIEE